MRRQKQWRRIPPCLGPAYAAAAAVTTGLILAAVNVKLLCALLQALELCWSQKPKREQPSLEVQGRILEPPLSWCTRGPSGQGFGDERQMGVWESRACGIWEVGWVMEHLGPPGWSGPT